MSAHQTSRQGIPAPGHDRQYPCAAAAQPYPARDAGRAGTDDARLRTMFDGLAKDGTVRAKLERQFWGDVFGAVTDKYGIGWQVNIGAAGA
jgi:hypothetical protein